MWAGSPCLADVSQAGSVIPGAVAIGGGFGGVVRGIGVYTVVNGQVRFIPAIDTTALAAMGVLLAGLVLRARRPRQQAPLTRAVAASGSDLCACHVDLTPPANPNHSPGRDPPRRRRRRTSIE